MKNLLIIVLLGLGAGKILGAQDTNGLVPIPGSQMRLTAQTGEFELHSQRAIYSGHVRVIDPQMKLTCEWMAIDMQSGSGHVNHIVCQTNVVIDFRDDKGQTNHATSDQAVYVYQATGTTTNETITLTGNPEVDSADALTKGDPIVWDRISDHVYYTNPDIIPRRSLIPAPAAASSIAKTNSIAITNIIATTNLPAMNLAVTNSPPIH